MGAKESSGKKRSVLSQQAAHANMHCNEAGRVKYIPEN